MNANTIKQALDQQANPEKRAILQRFFKTRPGEYGEGDIFIGLSVPQQRAIAKTYSTLPLPAVLELLRSKVHEHRLTALLIMVAHYTTGDEQTKKRVYQAYLRHTQHINNWDLVDLSAPKIVGDYLLDKDRGILMTLAEQGLWEKRIAMLATYTFIKQGETKDCFALAKRYLSEEHDLLHKATGWMLREVGKACGEEREEAFLRRYYRKMPRTMLRYAIERFPQAKRQAYLQGQIS